MNKQDVLSTLQSIKADSPKRNFKQAIDLIVTLKDMDLKKPDNHVDFFLPLHFSNGKSVKIAGLVGPEMAENAKKELDFAVVADDFAEYAKDKKKVKKLADGYTYFIAQANLMAKVAQSFGRVFGPKNKMPNPKAGCVVPANANLAQLKERLLKTVRIQVKTSLHFQIAVGKEDQKEEEVVDNIMTIFNQLVHHLPGESNNIKATYLKVTMGPAVKVGAASKAAEQNKKPAEKAPASGDSQ